MAKKRYTEEELKAHRKAARHKCYIHRRERELARNRVWCTTHPERRAIAKRTDRILRDYGITRAQYEHMWDTQHGECAICSDSVEGKGKCMIDHCHSTGRVRGLLCIRCNSVLGMARDSAMVLRHAINYLSQHSPE